MEDIKGVIRIRKLKDRQHNGQKKKDKQRSTKHVHKTRDRVKHTLLKIGVNSGALEDSVPLVAPSCSYSYKPGDKKFLTKTN